MSLANSLQNTMNFQRLEDFSSYSSCIKFFGKPIIPPLVTAEKRDEINSLQKSAIEKEIEILRGRESYSHHSRKAKGVYHMVEDYVATSNISNDFLPDSDDVQHFSSALHTCSMNELISSPSTDIRSFESSMHVSMTKIPSSDICSTVHTGVIVCPNIYSKNHEYTRGTHSNSSSYPVPPNEFCFHMANPECSLCQTGHLRGPFPIAGVPYINSPAERICSVSDDEQCSVAEETEFESLVTVIAGKKLSAQDTDNESNFTCLTQSTDLEKYMDCSIEYSSPDDGASLNKSQMSNQLNISSRSDDASSETLVNTESELTPCASALPELNGYIDEDNFDNSPGEKKVSSSTTIVSPDVQQRAHSVDSYMKIVKTCASSAFMRKSQSEPSHSDMSNFSNNFWPLTSSCGDGNPKPANLLLEVCADASKMSGDSVHLQVGDVELSCDNIGDPSTEERKVFKKKHIRTNSYTLEEPSPVLIMAHADCNCTDDSETVMSPHSCASDKMFTPTPNPAFKKEKINIILPPTPDRDKYFPLLISSTYYQKSNDETEFDTPVVDMKEPEAMTDNSVLNSTNLEDNCKSEEETSKSNVTKSISTVDDTPSLSNTVTADEVHLEQVEISLECEKEDISTTREEAAQPNEQNIVKSITSQSELKRDDLQSYLNEIILEIQEKQQTRVQKLLDEQNKQWLELQEEFKEQEKLLCSKLNLVGITPMDGNVLENMPPSLSGDKNRSNVESMPSDFQMCPDMKSLHDLNIRNKDGDGNRTTTRNYSNAFGMSLLKNSENMVNKEEKALVNENLLNASTQHSNISGDSVSPTNKNITDTLKPSHSANNTNFSSSFSRDSLERSHTTDKNITNTLKPYRSADNTNFSSSFSGDFFERSHTNNSSLSSRSISSLDYHKSHYFNDAVSRCSSAQSDNFAMSVPCSRSPLKMSNASMQASNYQPTMTTSSYLFANNASENMQDPAYEKHEILKPASGYDNGCLFKDRVCDASNILLQGAYHSVAIPPSNSLTGYARFHSDIQSLTNKNNFYTIPDPQKELKTEGIIPPSYHPSLHLDNLDLNEKEFQNRMKGTIPDSQKELKAEGIIPPPYHPSLHLDNLELNEKEKSSQNLSTCHHLSRREHFEKSSVFTSLDNCTSMALPIITDSAAIRKLEKNVACNHDNAFKEPETNSESSHFSGAIHLNCRDKYAKETEASKQHQSYPEKNNFVNGGLKNKTADIDLTAYQMSNTKADSAISDSIVYSHSNMSRKMFAKHPSSITKKSQSDSSISQFIHEMPANSIPTTTQAKAQKQIISSSLTNLKRKQSKDFIRDPNLLRKFEKLPAFVKGYLTRRLFKTERVQGLIKTLQDTAILIGKLGEELNLKGDAVSERDVDFHRQLIVQLMTTFHSIYDIFCTVSVKERMKIISESRSFEQKKKVAERSKDSPIPVMAEKAAETVPPRRSKLSAATVKALERKRRSTIDNRTYTVEDLKGCRLRMHSSTSSKSHSSSPSRIYKSSLGLPLKRKMTSVRKTQHWK